MNYPVKNEICTLAIDGYTNEGMGVGRTNGAVVFVPNAARGDVLSVRIVKALKSYCYGRIEEIITPSPHRVTPSCPAFPRCGGCDFLHISYEEELELKRRRVEDALRRIGGFDITLPPAIPSQREGYRNKAQFPLVEEKGVVRFGFYRSHSHEVVPFERCAIQNDRANTLAQAVCSWMNEYGITCYDEQRGKGLVKRIYVRTGAQGSQLCLVVTREKIPHTNALVSAVRGVCPDIKGVLLNISKEATNKTLGDKNLLLWGEEALEDTLMGLHFRLSPQSFYQVNHTQAENIYAKALEYAALTDRDTALDLFCGAGTITLLLAGQCREAIGAEIVAEAIDNAKENAFRNGIANVRFILGDAGQAAASLHSEGARPDVIVVDPPRKGMDALTVEAVLAMAPKRIVYVSCDPASLARDGKMLSEGYTLQKAEAFDMFPGTANIETVACFVGKKG